MLLALAWWDTGAPQEKTSDDICIGSNGSSEVQSIVADLHDMLEV